MYMEHKLALSTSGEERCLEKENMLKMKRAGVEYVEISYNSQIMKNFELAELVKNYRQAGIDVWSLHLPFNGYDIAALDEELRRRTLDYYEGLISQMAEANICTAVIHPCLEPVEVADRAARLEKAKKSLAELAEYAAQYDIVIAVEDLPRSCLGNCSEEILALLSADSRLMVCFDTNHLLNEKSADFLGKMRGRIRTVHVSDYDFENERHWLPGEGDIDWAEMMDALDATGYEGPILYELGLNAPKTIVRERMLTYADFEENRKALLRREKPAAIGCRIPNLGMWGPRE